MSCSSGVRAGVPNVRCDVPISTVFTIIRTTALAVSGRTVSRHFAGEDSYNGCPSRSSIRSIRTGRGMAPPEAIADMIIAMWSGETYTSPNPAPVRASSYSSLGTWPRLGSTGRSKGISCPNPNFARYSSSTGPPTWLTVTFPNTALAERAIASSRDIFGIPLPLRARIPPRVMP